MKQRLTKWLLLAALLPLSTVIAEPANHAPGWTVDTTLPIHQQPKLHPEISDPVLGDQAQIVEWAWSPQYAERFGLQPQPDGLPNGGLWLVGVKIKRQQYKQWQRYTCNIVGLMDNTLPIITPPGERYTDYPQMWAGGFPGKMLVKKEIEHQVEQRNFAPGFQAWFRQPKDERQQKFPRNSDGMVRYTTYIKNFTETLAYFEMAVSCAHFGEPSLLRNQIRFPTRIDGKDDEDSKVGAVFESSAVTFDLPDSLMRRIYPYTVNADDWTSCLMRRAGDKSDVLTLRASKSKRFGNSCEPAIKQQ